ncbi:aldehyde dehydrogenase family protein [Mangrovibacter yixingensis]|uniref:aldehyde dehydrogenase family protein n=1 Tax=Mangrovibacter yixingensis TaxID=1529639 RepID=UPI001CFA48B1|nr:aldehyde dehydrogenase family protein [Mangrovibacter yixingensis]
MTTTNTQTSATNPATGEILSSRPYASQADIEQAISQAASASKIWADTPLAQRAAAIIRLASVLENQAQTLAQTITREMGKPIRQARAEVAKCINLCHWYAEHGPLMLANQPTQVPGQQAEIAFRPLGVILAVMPWNFPLWQVLRGAVPMLLTGNTYLLKHAPNVPASAGLLVQAFLDADFPIGAFAEINASNEGVSSLIADPRVAAVALTGSARAGEAIGSQAGKALKKCVLELGGSDPFIVLNSADLDDAVNAGVAGRFQNTGQVCAAAKRFIVEEGIADAFIEKFVAATSKLVVGNPKDEQTDIGPMARFDLRDELHRQVAETIQQGATCILGGEKLPGEGNFYAPTILTGVTPAMTAFQEEMFGPVAAITIARDAEHALELANLSQYGLSATIYGEERLALQLAEKLECGGVFINGYSASDPRVPFGGVKRSGFGRELSHFGLYEFCNIQTVWKNRH